MAPLDRLRTGSVAAQILLLQLVVVAVVVIGGLGLAVVDARRDAVHAAGDVTLGVAEAMAASPTVRAGARSGTRRLVCSRTRSRFGRPPARASWW